VSLYVPGDIDEFKIIGIPGCVIYYEKTALDFIFPAIAAGIYIDRKDESRL